GKALLRIEQNSNTIGTKVSFSSRDTGSDTGMLISSFGQAHLKLAGESCKIGRGVTDYEAGLL
ncbi:MAG: hypothetical protein ABI197_07900, partial [Granulicella sp.]